MSELEILTLPRKLPCLYSSVVEHPTADRKVSGSKLVVILIFMFL